MAPWWYPNYEAVNACRRAPCDVKSRDRGVDRTGTVLRIFSCVFTIRHQGKRQRRSGKEKVQSTSGGLDWRWKLSRNQRSPVTHYTLVGSFNPSSPQSRPWVPQWVDQDSRWRQNSDFLFVSTSFQVNYEGLSPQLKWELKGKPSNKVKDGTNFGSNPLHQTIHHIILRNNNYYNYFSQPSNNNSISCEAVKDSLNFRFLYTSQKYNNAVLPLVISSITDVRGEPDTSKLDAHGTFSSLNMWWVELNMGWTNTKTNTNMGRNISVIYGQDHFKRL